METELIELFKKSKLPKNGWIQECFICHLPTSLTTNITNIEKNNRIIKFNCYICKDCKKEFKKNQVFYYDFIKDCKIYIYDKYYDLIY